MKILSVLTGLCFFVTTYAVSTLAISLADGSAGLDVLFVALFFGGAFAIIGFALALWAHHKRAVWLTRSIGTGLVVGFLLTLCVWLYHWQRDWPTVVLHAEYYNEDGFDLFLRKGGTFKILVTGWVGGSTTYGTYKMKGDTILLSKEVELSGGCRLQRRFIREGNQIYFNCEGGFSTRHSKGPLYIREAL